MSDAAGDASGPPDGACVAITAADGVRIALRRIGTATGTPAVLVPGTFSNHTFWLGTRGTGFARELAQSGYDTWVLDPRGHGLSARPRPHDHWRFDDWARRDVPAALEIAFAQRSGFVIGHSAGGAAALVAVATNPALRERVRGMVIIGTPFPWLQPFSRLGAITLRSLSRVLGRFPARALRLGPEDELAGVMIQWMDWNLAGHWRGDDGTDYGQAIAALDLPLLVIAAAADRWAPPPSCRALLDSVSSPDRTWLLLGTETGFSHDFGHVDMLVGRTARAEVWPLIRQWIDRRNVTSDRGGLSDPASSPKFRG